MSSSGFQISGFQSFDQNSVFRWMQITQHRTKLHDFVSENRAPVCPDFGQIRSSEVQYLDIHCIWLACSFLSLSSSSEQLSNFMSLMHLFWRKSVRRDRFINIDLCFLYTKCCSLIYLVISIFTIICKHRRRLIWMKILKML